MGLYFVLVWSRSLSRCRGIYGGKGGRLQAQFLFHAKEVMIKQSISKSLEIFPVVDPNGRQTRGWILGNVPQLKQVDTLEDHWSSPQSTWSPLTSKHTVNLWTKIILGPSAAWFISSLYNWEKFSFPERDYKVHFYLWVMLIFFHTDSDFSFDSLSLAYLSCNVLSRFPKILFCDK